MRGSDENRYAEIGREHLEDGNWFRSTLNGQPYSEKPQGYFWLVALASAPGGEVTPFTARLPSAIGGILLAFATFGLGMAFYSRSIAFLAAVLILVFPQTFKFAHVCRLDMLFAAGIAWTTYFLVKLIHGEGANRTAAVLFGSSLFLASLIKGPVVAFVLPVAIVGIHALLIREGWRLKRLLSPTVWITLGLLIGLYAGLAASVEGGLGHVKSLFVVAGSRTVGATDHAIEGVFRNLIFYPKALAKGVVIFFPFLLIGLFRHRPIRCEGGGIKMPFAFVGFLFIFGLFMFWTAKRPSYILPVYPFCALIIAECLQAFTDPESDMTARMRKACRFILWFGVVGLFGAAAFAPMYMLREGVQSIGPPIGATIGLGLLGFVLLQAVRKGSTEGTRMLIVCLGLIMVGWQAVSGRLNTERELAPVLKSRVLPHLGPETPVAAYANCEHAYPLILRRQIFCELRADTEAENRNGIRRLHTQMKKDPNTVLLVPLLYQKDLQEVFREPLQVIDVFPFGKHREMIALTRLSAEN